jgi:arylsulfatase A
MDKTLNRREFLGALGLGAASFAVPGCAGLSNPLSNKPSTGKPNIVLIMADDVGQPVLGCYGGTSYNTPNLDRLAAAGTRFNHCYSSPVCAPSRVKIMTGRYGFRNYKEWGHIPPEEVTFGHVLKDAGYATAIAGKWQMCLQKNDPNHITKMGFAQNCVFGWHEGPRYHGPLIYENGKLRQEPQDKYGPDIFCQFIIDFIKREQNAPFFAYYSTTLAHEISNDLKVPPPVGPNGRYQTYKELVEYLDKLIGRIVSTLDELGLRENTLILFTGDNGTPPKFITKAVNRKYISEPILSKVDDKIVIGGKGKLTDAGTKVPLIANWPGTTPMGKVSDDLIDFSDFMPTFAELAGTTPPKDRVIDGVSFAPQLMGKRGNPRGWAYCQWTGKAWARTQRFKLYRDGRLYDIQNDPLEESPVLSNADTTKTSAVRTKLQKVLDSLKKA